MVGLRPTSLGVAKENTSCYTAVLDPRYLLFKNEAMHRIHRIPERSCSPTLNKDTSLIIILVHRSVAVADPQQQHSIKYLRKQNTVQFKPLHFVFLICFVHGN